MMLRIFKKLTVNEQRTPKPVEGIVFALSCEP